MSRGETPSIQSFGLDLGKLPEADRIDAWSCTVGAGFEVSGLPRALAARARAWDLGDAVLTDVDHPQQTFVRDMARVRADGLDHVRVSVELTGGSRLGVDHSEIPVATRQAHLFDMGQPMTKVVGAGRVLCMALARDAVESVLPGVDLHGMTLGRSGAYVTEHFDALAKSLAAGDGAAPASLTLATLHMVAACVSPTLERLESARPVLTSALLQRARRFIRTHSENRSLSPDQIAKAMGVSRTTLYRAFEPDGGVGACIRRSRLEAARAALSSSKDRRRISEIADDYGFSSDAQFSRAFRAMFGASPRAFRDAPQPARPEARLDGYWLQQPPSSSPT